MQQAHAQGAKPPLTPDQLSSYIAVNADGTVSAFFGKMDMGHGLFVAIGQMVAEELDVPFKAVKVYMGDTATSVNQGGASGSTGIQFGGKQMRMAAAEARRVLVEMAAQKLGMPADQLIVIDGVITAGGQRRQEDVLRRADRRQILQRPARLEQADGQCALCPRQGAAEEAHRPQDRRQADQARGRRAEGVRPGGLLHRHQGAGHGARPDDPARRRRRGAGEGRRKLDQGHPRRPGGLHQNGFLGVVADKEWDAIKAAEKLKVEWSKVEPPFPNQNALYDHIRKAPVRKRAVEGKTTGNVDEAFKTAAKVIEAEYEWPFQSHAAWGRPARWSRSRTARSTAGPARRSRTSCRSASPRSSACRWRTSMCIWKNGPGSYGRNDADDCAADCAVLAKAVGKPVRLQYMRDAGHRLGPEGPGLDPPRPRGDRRAGQRHRL